MRKKLYVLALLAGWIFAGSKIWAAEGVVTAGEDKDAPAAVSVSDIEALSNRINDLAKFAKVSVLLQVQGVNSGNQAILPKGFSAGIKPPTGIPFYNDLFLGRRAELSVAGDLAEKRITYRVQYDPLATTTAKAGISNGEQLKDYWVRLSYIPFVDLQYGQYKFAQALEGRTSSGELDFNNTALVTTALEARRDLAFQISGSKIPLGSVNLEYAAALVQGAGQNNLDNNDNKDLAGRVGLTVTDPDWNIYLGASGYSGWETTVPSTLFLGARNNIGLEARVNIEGFKLQGEFIQGQLEPGNNYNPWAGTVTNPALLTYDNKNSNPLGWYATASYRWQDWRLGARVEGYNPDSTVGSKYNVNNDVLTVGLDWFQGKDKFKLSLNAEEHFLQYEALTVQAQVNI
jgi:hypothetical protein